MRKKALKFTKDGWKEVWRGEEMAQDDKGTLPGFLASENPGSNDLFSNEC
jgi:hypothetical protein